MSYRFVVIPEDIQLVEPRDRSTPIGKPKKFIDYAYEIWFNDPAGGEGGPMNLRRWIKMVDTFEKYQKPGDVVVLDEPDWRTLKNVIEKAKATFGPLIMAQCIAFSEAVINATESDPRPKSGKKKA